MVFFVTSPRNIYFSFSRAASLSAAREAVMKTGYNISLPPPMVYSRLSAEIKRNNSVESSVFLWLKSSIPRIIEKNCVLVSG